MKNQNTIQQSVLAAIYLTLGIPLIVISSQTPQILDLSSDLSKIKNINIDDGICMSLKMLNDAGIAGGKEKDDGKIEEAIQKELLGGSEHILTSKLNSLKTCTLIIGIILVCFAGLNIISIFIPAKK